MSSNLFESTPDDMWRAYTARLAGRLASLQRNQFIEIARTDTGTFRSLMEFRVLGSGRVRCSIGGQAFPIADVATIRQRRETLEEMGWRYLPRKWVYVHDVGRTALADLTALVARTLRETCGIAQPSQLTTHDPFLPSDEPPVDVPNEAPQRPLTAVPDLESGEQPPTTEIGIVPCCADGLLDLARTVVSTDLQRDVVVDDGLIELPHIDFAPSRILVTDESLQLVFTTTLTHRLTDPALLGRFMIEHSASWQDISFMVNHDHVYAQRVVDCAVFNPRIVSSALADWRHFLNDAGPTMVRQLNPGPPGSHDCTQNGLPVGLQTLLEMHLAEPLTPERIVHLTSGKVHRLNEYLAAAETTAADWKDSLTVTPDDPESEVDAENQLYNTMFRLFDDMSRLLREAIELASRSGD